MNKLTPAIFALCLCVPPLRAAQQDDLKDSLAPAAVPPALHNLPARVPALRPPSARLPAGLLPVPIVHQATNYSCGAAALLAVLQYWSVYNGKESGLYERLQTTPKDGTEPKKLVEGAWSFGLKAWMQENTDIADLRAALKRGETVILDLQAWRLAESVNTPWSKLWEDGHYVVLVGLDERNAYAMDPSAGSAYAYVPIHELLDRWHDYEDRHGPRHDYKHLAIFIQGKAHLKGFPAPLVRME